MIILDLNATLYVFNNLSRFSNFQKASQGDYFIARRSDISILKYGDVILQLKNDKNLKLKNMIYYINFAINLISMSHLINRGIHWNIISNTLFKDSDSSEVATFK